MKHPDKWRDTIDPFKLPYKNFKLLEVLGYPHAGNDVFHAKGICNKEELEVFIKVARQKGADIENEINVINLLNSSLAPQIIDFDLGETPFVVTVAKRGERLSTILGDNKGLESMEYLFEYGQVLAKMHSTTGEFKAVKDRRFFYVPEQNYFKENNLQFVYKYLTEKAPLEKNYCFCHGDFHYANVLWEDKHISAILDFELAGIGNREFDIAWAIIRRPGQPFLVKEEEVQRFLEGYLSIGNYCEEKIKYYMVLVYTYFYQIGINNEEYTSYVLKVFQKLCK
ncbi:MAG: aminoglycoside phosphotransferase family protein [Clostridia bacterium]|nr:aminoglycoside phosphotransferase family protein [Clostridia bacterium]